MNLLIKWFSSLAWDRILLLGSAGAILIYVNWYLAVAVALVAWAIIRGINDIMRNVGTVLTTQEMSVSVLIKELTNIKERVRNLEGGGDYVH